MTKHWAEDDSQRRAFWAKVRGDFGLDEDMVHYALSVDSLKDFKGGSNDAIMILAGFARGIGQTEDELACQAEAPFLAWTELTTPAGHTWTISYRECGLSEKARQLGWRRLRKAIEEGERLVADIGMVEVTRPQATSQPGEPLRLTGNDSLVKIDYLKVTMPQDKPCIELWRNGRKYKELSYYFGGDKFLTLCSTLQGTVTPEQLDTPGTKIDVPLEVAWRRSADGKYKDIVAARVAA